MSLLSVRLRSVLSYDLVIVMMIKRYDVFIILGVYVITKFEMILGA